jgi:hypothetical protein
MGEPVAEDFDFLHRALFEGVGSLFDGGGSQAFWRPLAHQIYYAALWRVMLAHPLAITALHLLLLAAGGLLLYRVFRGGLDGPTAAAAASFPLLAESTRTVLGWPTQFVDLGLFFFSVLALHEISRRRLVTALGALFAALWCKELAVVTAMLLPVLPIPASRRERVRWAVGTAGAAAVWGVAYLIVRRTAHLELPHGLERDATIATPITARLMWALRGSLRAIFSLPLVRDPGAAFASVGVLALCVTAAVAWLRSATVRARLRSRSGWLAWGLAWFGLATAALAPIYPLWQPNRSQIGSLGLGAASAVMLSAAHPLLSGGLVLVRLALLAVAPAPVTSISAEPPATGAFMDFARLTRLQRFMRETRTLLLGTHPTLAHGSSVVQLYMPRSAEYAFEGSKALQIWYRDSTLRWVRMEELQQHPELELAAAVEYEYQGKAHPALIPVEALRHALAADREQHAERWEAALPELARADSIAARSDAQQFLGNVAGARAMSLAVVGRNEAAEHEARRALALGADSPNAHFALAYVFYQRNLLSEARAELDSTLSLAPGYAPARELRARIDSAP